MKSSEKRFWELLDSILDGSYSDVEQREFSQLIDEHPELMPVLVEQMRTHSLLQWQSDPIHPQIMRGDLQAPIDAASSSEFARRVRGARKTWVWTIAAGLVVALGAAAWQIHRQAPAADLVVAEIVDSNQLMFSDATNAVKGKTQVVPGRFEVSSGSLTLRFRSGATLSTNGPASIDIDSAMLVRLHSGQAIAHVPKWAKGFTVQTPDATVVDLGTEFGVVARDNGLTDVVVFEGKVDITPTSGTAPGTMRLNQGEAAQVDNQGSIGRIVEVRRDQQGNQWSTGDASSAHSVFKSIRDNIKAADSSKYYQITPHGLIDDAPAYVDRPHQWNGLTSDGLPEFLRYADYVMTFNDYKYLNNLKIVVELSRPAMVYIFFDKRVPTPSWLSEQFENTGVKIGLDEDAWPEINPADPSLSTAVGSGNSIDSVFSVWSRRCETAETLELGSMGEKPGARAIYGIAATPLHQE